MRTGLDFMWRPLFLGLGAKTEFRSFPSYGEGEGKEEDGGKERKRKEGGKSFQFQDVDAS